MRYGFGLMLVWILIFIVGYIRGLFSVSKYELVILGICILMLIVGLHRSNVIANVYSKYDKLQYNNINENSADYVIEGEVTDIKRNTYSFTFTVKMKEGLAYVYSDSSILEMSDEDIYSSLYGKDIRVSGEIIPMKKARNYGNYDEYMTLRSKGVLIKLDADDIFVKNNGEYIWLDNTLGNLNYKEIDKLTVKGIIANLKLNMRKELREIATEEEYGILSAMILGDSQEVDKDIKELYSLSGISHIMAISGLHISLIGMGIYKLLRKRMRYISSASLSAGIMAMFLIFVGNPISATRAVMMFFVHIIADLFGRKYDVLSALSLSAIILLIDNPYYLMNASFQLSFVAMLAVSGCVPIVIESFFGENECCDKEKDGDNKSIKKNIWTNKLIASVFKILVFNIALNMFLMPINCYLFFRVSIYSPFVNIIVVPLVGLVLVMALFGMITTICIPTLGIFLIGTSIYILRFFTWLSEVVVSLPYASIITGKLTLKEIFVCYILLGGCLLILMNRKKIHYKMLLIAALLSIYFITIFREKYNGFSISFLDVGQGASIYIKSEAGNDYLIDGGSSDEKNIGEYKLESFLEARQVDKLEYVFVTHCDADHISGIVELIKRGNILIDNLVLPDISKDIRDEKYLELEVMANRQGINILHMKSGDEIKDGKLRLSCINPNVDENFETKKVSTDINESSLVLIAEYKSVTAIFTGDIGKETERELIGAMGQYNFSNRLVVYDVAHHGSGNSNSEEFIEFLKPKIAIVSCGKDNSYGHPAEEVLERLCEVGCDVLCTYESGQVEVYEGEDGMMISKQIR